MDHGNVSVEIAQGLLALRQRIQAAKIPPSQLDKSLNVATWNIREFGKADRSDAAIHYIAEILGQFDLIGIVELQENLADLGRVMKILGPDWRVTFSDVIPDAAGNWERLAFVYNTRALQFSGLAAEANPPRSHSGQQWETRLSWWRSPYFCSFQTGHYDFVALMAHIRWGNSLEGRRQELQLLADWVAAKQKSKFVEDCDLIVMGDFNIPAIDDDLFKAITSQGLQIPKALRGLDHGSNLEKNKRYDQILQSAQYDQSFTDVGGVMDFYLDESRIAELFPGGMSKTKFTFQLSDHLPLWMQVNTDVAGEQLHQIIRGRIA
jgi:endonuclease/exonuclease/phosphatase family metal-dependent hydrolase